LLYGLLHLSPVQNYIISKITGHLSSELHTTVKIEHVDFKFFDKLELNGLLIKDLKKDTLLYAGAAEVKITDWFFLKDKPVIHYAGLKNAAVYLHRAATDTIWNYQFLADYFGGSAQPKSKPAGKSNMQLDLKELHLAQIQLFQKDEWVGADLQVKLGSLHLQADTIDLLTKRVVLQKLQIHEPYIAMSDYTGERDRRGLTKPRVRKVWPANDTTLRWNAAGWVVKLQELELKNGVFKNDVETNRAMYATEFDGSHLQFTNISGTFKNVLFYKDTLSTQASFATKERSGFEVKKLEAGVKFTPRMMEFNNLSLSTNKSKLGDYYAMHYEDFNYDMGHFLHLVALEGNFNNSVLHSDDIAFFAPALSSWKRSVNLSGKATGTIDKLVAKNIVLKSGATRFEGGIKLTGLPDIAQTYIDAESKFLGTTYYELAAIIPTLKTVTQPNLSKLGAIQFKGNFTGFINDFVAYGNINSALGNIKGDINLKLPDGKIPRYKGNVSTAGFKLGEFIGTPALGPISFTGKIDGSGFTGKTLNADFNGDAASVSYNGYAYRNLFVKGNFSKNVFNGQAGINDPHLQMPLLTGKINFNKNEPEFFFDANLQKADFKNLGLSKDSFVLGGNFKLRFTGSDIDNFLGSANVNDATLTHNGTRLSFDSLLLQSFYRDSVKYLSLQTNEAEAAIKGNFKILELPDAFKYFLNRYYPAYIAKPTYKLSNQEFSFDISTRAVDSYVHLLDKNLSGFNNASVTGMLHLSENRLDVDAIIPELGYKGKKISNVVLEGRGGSDSLKTTLVANEITLTDSMHLPLANLSIVSFNDTSLLSIKTSASKTINDAAISARLLTMKDGIELYFFPSSVIINDKKWELEKDGEIRIKNNSVDINEVRFVQGQQQIVIATEPSPSGESNDIVVTTEKLILDDFSGIFMPEPRLEGQVNGEFRIVDPFKNPVLEYDARINQFMLDGDSIGLMTLNGNFDVASNALKIQAQSTNVNNQLAIDGTIDFDDSTSNRTRLMLRSDKFNLAILNNYLGGIFSQISGSANTTDLVLSGNTKHFLLTGTANISEASLTVGFTQCKYKLKNESIVFNEDEIDFGTIALTDTLNNKGRLSGKLRHKFFSRFVFDDIKVETDRMLVLNTNRLHNKQFYGKVIGEARMTINGDERNMQMDIFGEPSRADSSHVYIVSASSIETGEITYIDFVPLGREMDDNFINRDDLNVIVNMELRANPSCKVDVVLDETTADVIKGEGDGLLKIRVGNKEPLTINGKYTISKGEYTFNFQTILKKFFKVTSGSTLIWDGDPFAARIDIFAEYEAEKVDFTSISPNYRQREDLNIVAHLTNTLLKPDIDFEFVLPPASPITDFVIIKKLQQFREDKNEMNKQLTSLLLFNQFLGTSQGVLTAGSTINALSNTIGGVVSSAVSGFFNKLLKNVKNLTINFDVNSRVNGGDGTTDLQTSVARLQTAANSNLIYTLLNGRLIISAGVNLDYNNPFTNATRNSNLLVTPDIMAEWILTKDGRVRVIGFNRTNFDLVAQRNRTGISLSYRKDADTVADIFAIFGNRKKKKAAASPATE
jgi:hypothetical protein